MRQALAVSERLAASNPGSAAAQRDLSVSLNKLGNVLVQAGELSAARARYEAALAVSERLAASNPGSAGRSGISRFHLNVGATFK